MNLIEMFLKGGLVMWPILACSIIGLAIAIEKFMVIRKAKINVPVFSIKIRGILKRKRSCRSYQLLHGREIANLKYYPPGD